MCIAWAALPLCARLVTGVHAGATLLQEVFAEDKPRMSISGWYHAPAEPEGAHLASLQQLQQQKGGQGGDKGGKQGGPHTAPEAAPLPKGADLLAASAYQPFRDPGQGAGEH